MDADVWRRVQALKRWTGDSTLEILDEFKRETELWKQQALIDEMASLNERCDTLTESYDYLCKCEGTGT